MHFEPTEDERLIRDTARELAEKEFAPKAARFDETCEFPHENVVKLSELGFMGMCVEEKWGGAGLSGLAYAIAMEEISRACASTGVIMSVQNSLVCDPIQKFGNDAQKDKYLRPLAQGEVIGAYCLTEPEAGSDAQNQRTTAIRDGDHYLLNGTKNFITNGKVADVYIVYCKTDPAAGHKGISALIVDGNSEGLTRGQKENTMGIRASSTCSLFFSNVRVPAENLLGPEGKGFSIALATLDGGRIGIAAQALGIAQAALDAATRYAQERKTFGRPIAELQAIQWMLADSATEVEAARLLTYRAARKKDSGERYSLEASMAKLAASRTAVSVADRAVQVHGGVGLMKETGIERAFRFARLLRIPEGTSEIQRWTIAKTLGL